jgi:hypothetical protein
MGIRLSLLLARGFARFIGLSIKGAAATAAYWLLAPLKDSSLDATFPGLLRPAPGLETP